MKDRKIILYIASGLVILSLLVAFYFFAKKPARFTPSSIDAENKMIVFKDVQYSGEKKGIIDWEIKAKIARKYIDKPVVEMEDIEGQYKPKADTAVIFHGSKGSMDTELEKGTMEDVDIIYKNDYRLRSKHMNFDFKAGTTGTSSPVDIKGSKLAIRGVGLAANTKEETVRIIQDVSGSVETAKGRFKFQSDRFTYALKNHMYILEGKVVMKGEPMNLLCEKLYIFTKNNDLESLEAKGNVRMISKGTIAKSERAVYHFKEDKVIMSDKTKILKDNIEMEGNSVIYSVPNKKFSIDKPKTRVEKNE